MKNFTQIKSASCLLMFFLIPFGITAQNQLNNINQIEMLIIEPTTPATNTGNLVLSSNGTIPISDIATGTYLVKIISNNQSVVKRFIKQ